ncbi:MAG: three-Cys-motif partner protein TcmP [Bacteroidia bacterium]|nr:three-Cys-motif partner protein TcmP [Bacteroidia bacterium]MDW8348306.1 three-Cys-motif partner protein TcmP [Bacteroidia bacterium]
MEHSKAKVKLLGKYLEKYFNIICNTAHIQQIHVYDLFCGEGVYKDGSEGSPIVILNQINNINPIIQNKLGNTIKIHCTFNDNDPKKVEKLQATIKQRNLHNLHYGDIFFETKDYKEQCEIITQKLSKQKKFEKTFIFIDPYGYKHIKINQIKSFMVHGNAEVLLWLPTQFMYRFSNNGTPEALKDFISEIFQDFNKWKSTNSVWEFIKQLKEGFKRNLDGVYVDTFTIQKDQNTVFCLFFFTTHIRGFEEMLETKWEIDTEQGRGWSYIQSQRGESLFPEEKTNSLEESLTKYLEGTPRSNVEIYEFTLREGFLPKHTNEVFSNWQSNNRLEVIPQGAEKVRKGAFYIAYKYYKDKNKKVIFQMR